MSVPMELVIKYRTMFITLQRENNVSDMFNINDAKWTLRDIMTQLGDEKNTEKLIRFFFLTSDSKTWDDFQYNYDKYYESWENYRIARLRRKALQEETINRKSVR